MPSVTYHVAVPFSRDDEGNLLPGEAKECSIADRAKRMVQGMAAKHAGAIAFSRTGDAEAGDFQDAQIIAVFGAVDVSALGGLEPQRAVSGQQLGLILLRPTRHDPKRPIGQRPLQL